MKTKLTLRLDKDIIKKAKLYSKNRGESVSSLVEKFFNSLDENIEEESLPPITKKLKGLLKGAKVSEEDYKKFLEEKYL